VQPASAVIATAIADNSTITPCAAASRRARTDNEPVADGGETLERIDRIYPLTNVASTVLRGASWWRGTTTHAGIVFMGSVGARSYRPGVTKQTYAFAAPLWVHPGEGAWHFLTVPQDICTEIAERTSSNRQSFGSVRVVARVGETAWRTSLFPDAKTGTYLLPVKKGIRVAAQLRAGDLIEVEVEVEVALDSATAVPG